MQGWGLFDVYIKGIIFFEEIPTVLGDVFLTNSIHASGRQYPEINALKTAYIRK
jgi:hypothetical protein